MAVINRAIQPSLRTNRLRSISPIDWREMIDHELAVVPQRILTETGGVLKIKFTDCVRAFIWREAGTELPARRAIQRAIERQLITPLLKLIRTGQLSAGRTLIVEVDEQGKRLLFHFQSVPRPSRAVLL